MKVAIVGSRSFTDSKVATAVRLALGRDLNAAQNILALGRSAVAGEA
ncbi:MAG: hypothetical protein GYA73_03575 [Planctomycetes bacterium]|nr:hypothetical protein [Planctomycetota bacterium]